MFQHVFATMHELLDEIMVHFGSAELDQKKRYFEQLSMLKSMSDTFIEEWLQFEEKLAEFRNTYRDAPDGGKPSGVPSAAVGPPVAPVGKPEGDKPANGLSSQPAVPKQPVMQDPGNETGLMVKGQGYFKLFMFKEAADHFEQAVQAAPENNMARLFLAMTHMHLQQWQEAQRHFQLLVELTDHPKWQALGYNALGCIQAVRMNLEQAERYFLKAHETDPAFTDPLSNLKSCQKQDGHLSLYFGSGQL
ncbi:tetratricopeptide repeat protein [Paenibacillus xanthanilyticus]|uniref:Tetratricopeptide repeat protein n=1 Tax=Paenibacillus xanthanilyticus TaxID=1783531 RepID=A0ABV8KCQ5_9BACL